MSLLRAVKTGRFEKSNVVLTLALMVITGLLCLRDLSGVSVNKYTFLAVYIAAFVLIDSRRIAFLMAFTIPVLYGLPDTYIMLAACAFLVLKRNDYDARLLLIPILLSAQELVLTFWYPSIDLVEETSFISALFLMALLSQAPEADAKSFLVYYLLGTAVGMGVLIFSKSNELGIDTLMSGTVRLGEYTSEVVEGMRIKYNANEVGYFSLVGISCALLLYLRSDANRVVLTVCTAFCVVADLLCQSLTWLMFVAAILVFQLFLSIRSPRQLFAAGLVLLVVVAGAVVFLQLNPGTFEGLMGRFENDANLSTGGGRATLFATYNDSFFSMGPLRLAFGTGVTEYKEIAGIYNSMHNGLQQSYVCLGLIGSLLYWSMVALLVWRSVDSQKKPWINWLPLLSVLAFTMSIQLLNPWILMLPLVCGFNALKLEGCKRTSLFVRSKPTTTLAKQGKGDALE